MALVVELSEEQLEVGPAHRLLSPILDLLDLGHDAVFRK